MEKRIRAEKALVKFTKDSSHNQAFAFFSPKKCSRASANLPKTC
jgi:hypothetical protein